MYMGGMKTFQRYGQGIMLYDNGTSSVCNHEKDFRQGHNISFSARCTISSMYSRNRLLESVYKDSNYLLFLSFNSVGVLDGRAVLLDYSNKTIYHVVYRKGSII